MKEEENYFQETKKRLKLYFDQRVLLFRLQATEKISRIAASLFTTLLLAAIGLLFLLFLSITAGIWIGKMIGSTAGGFGIVALFYLIIFLFVMIFLRKILLNSFINKFIKLIHKKDL